MVLVCRVSILRGRKIYLKYCAECNGNAMTRAKIFTSTFAAIGLAVPILVIVAKALSPAGFSPIWIYYVWPSYFILGGMAGRIDLVTVAYLAGSILLNVLLYAYVGYVLGRLFAFTANERKSKRNARL